jgi:hypothetical protein
MKRVDRSEVLPVGEYEAVRESFRRRVIDTKRRRRVQLGSQMSAVFENHDSVLLQIQEMLRTERISKEDGVLHELATYNELIPAEDELSLTLFVEIPEREERERMLSALAGLEEKVALEIDGESVFALGEARDGARADRTTAVHYFKIPLPRELAQKLRTGGAQRVGLAVAHPAYDVRIPLSRDLVAELASDLA